MKKNESGFSLFELMVVIAIIGILSAIAIPNFIAWRNNASLKGAAFNLKSDLEMAKMRAIRGGSNVAVLFDDNGYVIFQDIAGDYENNGADSVIATRVLNNITITRAFLGGSADATEFNNRGQVPVKTGNATLSLGNKSVTIEINRIGLISMKFN
ncbi:GspH/FimT family pseudopilin [Desulforegula conservatrix]|uniref:GspH/FimT family pseudopilin n=1 Tax=Desulforegula conservatrix TaxID=153026 RepID=UPI000486FA35|nr:GspH/FimT family pseudopilin [Desulforegula conservatrix]